MNWARFWMEQYEQAMERVRELEAQLRIAQNALHAVVDGHLPELAVATHALSAMARVEKEKHRNESINH